MMEKLPLHSREGHHDGRDAASPTNACSRRGRIVPCLFRRTLVAILICFVLYIFVSRSFINCSSLPSSFRQVLAFEDDAAFSAVDHLQDSHGSAVTEQAHRVPLEAHIMSKCPDARDCLKELIVPAMEKISDKVDFKLSFIASVSNKSSEVECKHGPTECIGDMLILCAANLPFLPSEDSAALQPASYPRTPTIRSLGFANCLIESYSFIPKRELVEGCALEHGIDFQALNKCASQQDDGNGGGGGDTPSGIALLRESALYSDGLGVKTSCTVRLDETVWCVRDGGVWKDCALGGEGSKVSVFVDEVEKLYKERN